MSATDRAEQLKSAAELFEKAAGDAQEGEDSTLPGIRDKLKETLTPESIKNLTDMVHGLMGKDPLEGGGRRRTRSARSSKRRAKSRRRRYYY